MQEVLGCGIIQFGSLTLSRAIKMFDWRSKEVLKDPQSPLGTLRLYIQILRFYHFVAHSDTLTPLLTLLQLQVTIAPDREKKKEVNPHSLCYLPLALFLSPVPACCCLSLLSLSTTFLFSSLLLPAIQLRLHRNLATHHFLMTPAFVFMMAGGCLYV